MGSNRRSNVLNLRDQVLIDYLFYRFLLCLLIFQPKLIKAILRNDKQLVRHLIGNEEEVNKCDHMRRSPLHLCSSLGYTEIAQMLIEAGARVNARDNDWVSPLHRACCNNHDPIVKLLLENGAEANTRDRQWITPMHVCAANNGLECATILLPYINTIDASDRSVP